MAETFAEILERSTERCRTMDAPLGERLAAFAEDVARLSPEFASIVERMVARLAASGAGNAAPGIGEKLPRFVLPDQSGRLVDLAELVADGPAVVAFHRGHWCPYCRLSADGLARIAPEVASHGGRIVAITPEVAAFAGKLKEDAAAPFPILTDLDNAYALQIGLAIWINDEKRTAMSEAGWDIGVFQHNAAWILPIPATFVIGRDGLVKARFVDPDYRRRMDLEAILAAVREAAA